MNFLCPACRTALSRPAGAQLAVCERCGVSVDLTRVDTAPGQAHLWPEIDLTGETLGSYKLLERIGAGGMGAVYAAEGPDGSCAVKVLSALLAADPALRERFRREAAALKSVTDPGVVRVLEEGEERGFSWFAMERVAGSDLRARLSKGPLSATEVARLASQLLATLGAIHGSGLVHRDVKPSNILLDDRGARLCDFGIARFDGAVTLTESAAIMGSLRYMAPEQRRGVASAASDLFSTGMVLFEALAGGVPGEATLPLTTPRALRRLIERLLRDDPAARPRSAEKALTLMRTSSPGPLVLASGAAVVIALGGAVAIGARSVPTTRVEAVDAGPAKDAEPIDAAPADAEASPDVGSIGRSLVVVETKTATPAATKPDTAPPSKLGTAPPKLGRVKKPIIKPRSKAKKIKVEAE